MRIVRATALPAELARAQRAALTYTDLGGLRNTEHRLRVGSGADDLEQAENALFSWRAQSGAGLRVAADGPVAEGGTVVLGLGRPLSLVIPCRVVRVVRAEGRRGFAYGTLPGHPVTGEESFTLTLEPDGAVWLTIEARSRPGHVLVRLGGPLARAVQRFYLHRYAAAIRRAVRNPGPGTP